MFKLRKGEIIPAAVAFVLFTALHVMNMLRYSDIFNIVANGGRGIKLSTFTRLYHLSGFDPITYFVLTDWHSTYNIYRHPLLAYMMWPVSMLNNWIQEQLGQNWAMPIMAAILLFCSFYSFVFLRRIFLEIIGLKSAESTALTALTFSFAYVMLATFAPDHFGISMFLLIWTLYLTGRKMQMGSAMNCLETVGLFILTAGVSLNNGLKTFLAALFSRRKRFFRPGYLLLAVILPSALIWQSARWSYKEFVLPSEKAAQIKKKQVESKLSPEQKEIVRKHRQHNAFNRHTGKPIAKGEFLGKGWTDGTTSRFDAITENMFGEGIMLHRQYALGDVLVKRPVVVRYANWGNYVVEAVLLLLFCGGIWAGRKERFMWLALSFFAMDAGIHLGLGFAINEIYIMSAHYLFVLPLAMGYLLRISNERWRRYSVPLLSVLAAYIFVWNIRILIMYLFILS